MITHAGASQMITTHAVIMADWPTMLAALEAARIENGLSKKEVARRAGVSPQSATEWLNGTHEPTGTRLLALVGAVGLRVALVAPRARPE